MDDLTRFYKELKDLITKIRDSQFKTESDLKYHIKRTDTLEELYKQNEKRIELLEEPKKAREYIFGVVIDTGKFTAFLLSVLAILKAFNLI